MKGRPLLKKHLAQSFLTKNIQLTYFLIISEQNHGKNH